MNQEAADTKKKPMRARGSGSVYKPKGSRIYYIKYWCNGKRVTENTKSERKQDAQSLLNDRLGDAGKGIPVGPKVNRVTLNQALGAVVDNMRMNGRDSVMCPICKVLCCDIEGHGNGVQRRIKHIVWQPAKQDAPESGFFRGDRLMSTITTSDLTAYASHRLGQRAAAASVNRELALIRRAFSLAVRSGQLIAKPHVPMLAENNTRTGFFETAEYEAVRHALPVELRGIATFAFFTGWRVTSEILPLQWSQVDREAKVIRLHAGTTKNNKGRVLPYGKLPELVTVIDGAWTAHEALMEKGMLSPFVFQRNGKAIKSFRKAWDTACENAGYPGKLLHDFRRTAVRNLVRRGVADKTAMMITGHKTRSVFDRYDIVTERDIEDGLAKLSGQPTTTEQPTGQVHQFTRQSA